MNILYLATCITLMSVSSLVILHSNEASDDWVTVASAGQP